jgi:hypothetical protein
MHPFATNSNFIKLYKVIDNKVANAEPIIPYRIKTRFNVIVANFEHQS